jgi:hypothetical protein
MLTAEATRPGAELVTGLRFVMHVAFDIMKAVEE